MPKKLKKIPNETKAALHEEVRKELARKDYGSYVEYVHEGSYKHARHTRFITNVIQEAIDKRKEMLAGKRNPEVQYIALNCPPRHSKSMSVTETLPSYFLGHFPKDRVIECSYNENFAQKFGRKNRQKVARFGYDLFGRGLSTNSTSVTDWYMENNEGGMISRGILSGVTGEGADLMIIDDPVKNRKEAESETIRDSIWEEWVDSLSTRLHPCAICILILTRWHDDDLQGRLLSEEHGGLLDWKVYNFSLECDTKDDPLDREFGEPLWPERYGYAFITSRKKYPRSYNSLYQGRPSAAEGNILKRHWWQYYEELPECTQYLMSVDCAFKDEKDSDFVAIQVWGKLNEDYYLVDSLKKRMDFTDTLKAIRTMAKKHPKAVLKLIEDKANGSAIISVLRKKMGGIVPVNPSGGKIARVYAVSPFIESGNVYLPKFASFTQDFVEECAAFPSGAHDDQVDSMSQALNRFIYFNATKKEEEEETKIQRHKKELAKKSKNKRLQARIN